MTGLADLAPLVYTPDGGVATTLAVRNVGIGFGLANQAIRHSGRLFASTIAHLGGTPAITVQMPVKQALDEFGLGMTKITDLKIFLATFADGERQAGANHVAFHAASGAYAVVESFQAAPKQVSFATVRFIPLSADDVSQPYAWLTGQSLPTLSAEPTLNTMGPLAIGNVRVDGMQSLQVNLGQQMSALGVDGRRFPREVVYRGGSPRISGSFIGVTDLRTAAGFEGTNLTDLDIYLRENDPDNETLKTTGIQLTVADGLIQVDQSSFQQDSAGVSQFTVICESDSDTHPIAYTASATVVS